MISVVIGLGFGDEGKGLVTEYLCSNPGTLVVRYSGGQQAGHTVFKDKIRHIFSNFGSGTLSGTPTYWSKFCTVDPIGLMNELHILLKKGVLPTLFIHKKCPITTPYDTKHNQICDKNNGTCGVGVGRTIVREENHYSLLVGDILFPSVFKMKLDLIKYYYRIHEKISLNRFNECIEGIKNNHIIFVDEKPDCIHTVFEGSQGLLLDQNIGFFPHVTHGSVGLKNIIVRGTDFADMEVYLVTRAYQTRHGKGPMTNENIPHNILLDKDETNITNKFQGEFRRSLLDLDLLKYAIDKEYQLKYVKKTLVITCLDHIINEYRYTHKGNIVYCDDEDQFIDQISSLLGITNILISRTPYSSKIERWTP